MILKKGNLLSGILARVNVPDFEGIIMPYGVLVPELQSHIDANTLMGCSIWSRDLRLSKVSFCVRQVIVINKVDVFIICNIMDTVEGHRLLDVPDGGHKRLKFSCKFKEITYYKSTNFDLDNHVCDIDISHINIIGC